MIELFRDSIPDSTWDDWKAIDSNFEENFKPLKEAIENYGKGNWGFMEKYLVNVFILISVTSSIEQVKSAKSFIRYSDVDFTKLTPYYTLESELGNHSLNYSLSSIDESTHPRPHSRGLPGDALVLYHGKRDAVINLLKQPTIEQSETNKLRDIIMKENDARMFENMFGNPTPPPEDFDVYKIIFEDLGYLDLLKHLQLDNILKKIIYPRPE